MIVKDVEIKCTLIRRTHGAFLIGDGDREVWISRSQIRGWEEDFIGDNIIIVIPEWLAIEKDLV